MNNIQQKIQEIKTKGYDLDFSNVINASIENFKKIAMTAGIAFIIFTIVLGFIFITLMGGFYGFSSLSSVMTNFNVANFSLFESLIYLLLMVIIGAIVAPFYAGILKIAFLADQNLEFSVGTSFEYYKGIYFKEIIIAAALIALIGSGLTTLSELSGGSFFSGLFTYLIAFLTILVNPLIIFGKLNAIESIKASVMVVGKQIPVLIGLLIVSLIISCLGLIGLCIGIFFTLPFIFSVYYVIYKQIFGVTSTS